MIRLPNIHPLRAPGLLAAAALALLPAVPLAAADKNPLKVFLLVGQSNMQGHAKIPTLAHLGMDPETAPLLKKLQDDDGNPRVCEDVWISSLQNDGVRQGPLTAGYGAGEDKIGPEFSFGVTMQELLGEPILLIKTAWGGKSINTDFRSPGAGPYVFNEAQLENFKKQGKNLDEIKAAKAEATGEYYRLMLDHAKEVLGDIGSVVPDYDADAGYELAGFVWFQGWNDMVDRGTYPTRDQPGGYDAYTTVMAQFIRDVRKDLEVPELPFVIGVIGVGGPTSEYGPDQQRYKTTHQNIRDAMAAPAKLPEFEGNVAAVLTENCWDPKLDEVIANANKVKAKAKELEKDKSLSPEARKAAVEQFKAEVYPPEDEKLRELAISNAGYHYLGSGKILALIGKAFAEAAHGLQKD